MRHDLVLADDRLANAGDDLVRRDAVPIGALDLLDDDELLRRIALGDGERGAAMPTQGGVAALDGILDVLQIMVGAAGPYPASPTPTNSRVMSSMVNTKVVRNFFNMYQSSFFMSSKRAN